MYTRITAVLLALLLTTLQCRKDNDLDKHAGTLQGSWRLDHSTDMDGITYPAPGSLTIVKFDNYNMLTYAHDTLLKSEIFFTTIQKDPVTQADIPSIAFAASSYSGMPIAFSVRNDTLLLYTLHTTDGNFRTYIRIRP